MLSSQKLSSRLKFKVGSCLSGHFICSASAIFVVSLESLRQFCAPNITLSRQIDLYWKIVWFQNDHTGYVHR